mmetsp:Transcript_21320/g.63695  ORF Transcript_21320/g.63695 Transcript_21320/m.63695 type:complete len:176 (+) Transcript_21320:414-941(+)
MSAPSDAGEACALATEVASPCEEEVVVDVDDEVVVELVDESVVLLELVLVLLVEVVVVRVWVPEVEDDVVVEVVLVEDVRVDVADDCVDVVLAVEVVLVMDAVVVLVVVDAEAVVRFVLPCDSTAAAARPAHPGVHGLRLQYLAASTPMRHARHTAVVVAQHSASPSSSGSMSLS